MGKIVVKIVLMLVIQIIVIKFIWSFVPLKSAAWGDDYGNVKYRYYQKHCAGFNALFIGSSLFYRHIDPYLFNAHFSAEGMKSFNMGAPAFFGHKDLFLLNDILENNKELPKNIFMEFDIGYTNLKANAHHPKEFFPYSVTVSLFLVKSVLNSDLNIADKVKYLDIHLNNFIDNTIKLGLGSTICSGLLLREPIGTTTSELHLGRRLDGYYPLDFELADSPDDPEIIRRSRHLTESPRLLEEIRLSAQHEFRKVTPGKNNALAKFFRNLITKAESKKVRLIFVMTPRRGELYRHLLPLFSTIPPKNRIELANPATYPEFYSKEFSFDGWHLNNAGAQLFTEMLSQKFKELPN